MESLLSINGVAEVLAWIGLPVLAGAALLAGLVLSGAAERIIVFVEDGSIGRRKTITARRLKEETRTC